jgi:hypothetical protein
VAADTPLNQLTLAAASVADDLGYVALADIASAFEANTSGSYRVIGGHMVTALVARWNLGAELYRETRDTDLGSPPAIIRDHHIIEKLIELGYVKVEGNRFAKPVTDVPVRVSGGHHAEHGAIIDVLVPAYTRRARRNHRATDLLVTTEVPGLAAALQRPAVPLRLQLHRLNGQVLEVELNFPDELAALVLKAFATDVRTKATDIVDLWRCLEIAYAAGVDSRQFEGHDAVRAVTLVRELFDRRDGPGMAALQTERGLPNPAADQLFTRLRALMARVLGPS